MKLLSLLLLFVSYSVLADEACGPLESYTVSAPVSFEKSNLKDAVEKLVAGTGLKVISEDTTGIVLSGKNVSGPLGVLLVKMGNSAHFSVKKTGCVVTVTPVDKNGKEIIPVWSVSKDESLSDALTEWSKISGWSLSYEIDGKILLGANLNFNGDYEGAVELLLDTIKNSSGVDMRHHFYYKNKMLRVYRDALVAAAPLSDQAPSTTTAKDKQ